MAPALPIAKRADGDSGGHLDGGEQGIHTAQHLAFHRDAEHGQKRVGGEDSGEVRGAAGCGDDDF